MTLVSPGEFSVLHICSSLAQGGMARFIIDIVNLQSSRFRTGILTTTCPGHHWNEAAMGPGECMQVQSDQKLRRYLQALRTIAKWKPTVVHVHQEPYAPILARIAQIPAVVETVHHYEFWRENGHWLVRQLRKHCLDMSVAVSNSQLEKLVNLGGITPSKARLILNGITISHDKTVRTRHREEIRIGAIGRFVHWKGFETLATAFSKVIESHQNATLHLAGEGEELNSLKNLVERLGIEESVYFYGYVECPRTFIRGMDIMVFPSLPQEPFGLVIVEILAEGVPLIASRIPSVLEICRNGKDATLFDPGDHLDLERAINSIIDRPDLASTLARSGQMRAQNAFSINRTVADYSELYGAILRRKKQLAPNLPLNSDSSSTLEKP